MARPAKIRLPADVAQQASNIMNALRHARSNSDALSAAQDADVIVSISEVGRWTVTDPTLRATLQAFAQERVAAEVVGYEAQLAELEIEVEPPPARGRP